MTMGKLSSYLAYNMPQI